MPLIRSTSKKARQKNIATEIRAGKDPKQAVAIAYSVQRRAKRKGHGLGHAARRMAKHHGHTE